MNVVNRLVLFHIILDSEGDSLGQSGHQSSSHRSCSLRQGPQRRERRI